MPTTTNVDISTGVASIGARTDSAGAAVDDITAEELRLPTSVFTEGKISPADAWKVNADAPASMDVLVGSGAAKTDIFAVTGNIAGQGTYLVRLDSATATVTIAAADASQQRIDEVYLVVADAPYDGGTVSLPRLGYRKGDAGGAAPGPDAAWDAFALLATVTVPAAATEIVAGNITDGRATSFLSAGVLLPDGSAAAPALGFAEEPNTGLHRQAPGQVRVVGLGTVLLDLIENGTTHVARPGTDAVVDLGQVGLRFKDMFLSGHVKDAAGNPKYAQIAAGSYTGNGATNRKIALAFDPKFVIVSGGASGVTPYAFSPLPGGTFGFHVDSTPTTEMTGLAAAVPLPTTGGFTVSVSASPDTTELNHNGSAYFYVAFG